MEEEAENDEEAGEQSDDAESDSNGNTHIFDRMSTKLIISLEEIQDDDDEALFDLSAAVPPADPPNIVQPSKKTKKKTVALRPDRMPYYNACKHDGSDTTSGATESSESSNSMDEWLDKSPVMTSKEQKKVNRFMQKVTGKKRRYK